MSSNNGNEQELVPTSIGDIRAQSRKIVKSPGGFVFEIRKVNTSELLNAGMTPVIKVQSEDAPAKRRHPDDETPEETAKEMNVDMAQTMSKILCSCVVNPRLSSDPEDTGNPERLYIGELGGDDIWLFNEIFSFSGLSAKSKKEVESYLGNGDSSGSSTEQQVGTE